MASSETNSDEEYPPESRKFIRRMIKKCNDMDQLESNNTDYIINRIHILTGLQVCVIRILSMSSKIIVVEKLVAVDRCVIQNELHNFYSSYKMIPTSTQLFNALDNKIAPYIDRDMFRKILVKMGYVWKVISTKTGSYAVVIENPKVAFERHNYLSDIQRFIKNDTPVFYVDENSFDLKGNYYDMSETKILLNKPNSKLKFQGVIYAVSKNEVVALKFIEGLNENSFENFISNELMTYLTAPSVIVMNKAKHHCRKLREPPTYDSLKAEIVEWLDYHQVPCKKSMSKAQLFDLVEKYTDLEANMYAVDKILETRGHRVLRIPDCINNLTISNCVCKLIKKNISRYAVTSLDESLREHFNNKYKDIINSITPETLERYHKHICKEYESIMSADSNLDMTFDTILESMYHLPVEEELSDIPDLSDSDIDSDD